MKFDAVIAIRVDNETQQVVEHHLQELSDTQKEAILEGVSLIGTLATWMAVLSDNLFSPLVVGSNWVTVLSPTSNSTWRYYVKY